MRYYETLDIQIHRYLMSNVLLIHNGKREGLMIDRLLSARGIACVCFDLEEFHPEFLLAEMFDLIIFELSGDNRSCVAILKELERWATTSGIEHPPVIVVTEDNSEQIEQAVRAAKINFFFVKPVTEAEMISAIDQSLQLNSIM